jgi:hypothetical protein
MHKHYKLYSVHASLRPLGEIWSEVTVCVAQSELSVRSEICYAVSHSLLKYFVPVFFQTLDAELQRYHSACRALTD